MPIKYYEAEDIKEKIRKIVDVLGFKHIQLWRVFCVRSKGSTSRNIIARCHSLPRILQEALKLEPAYLIEVISEKFDKQTEEEQIKTLIHELLHIPKSFGGGFIHHNVVRERTVNKFYRVYFQESTKKQKDLIGNAVEDRKV